VPVEYRPVTEEEWPEFLDADRLSFSIRPGDDEYAAERRAWPIERSVAAFEDGRIVGTAGAYPFELTLPGCVSVPAAGVTWVGVLATHRRRGVLTGMMRYQLDDVRARGESVAVLLASESIIYGRFGYGLATTQVDLELPREHGDLAKAVDPPGRLRLVDDATAEKVLPDIHERVRRQQPGDLSRTEAWWAAFFRSARKGGSFGPRLTVVYEGIDGDVEGYAYYRVRADFATPLSSDWTVLVQGMGALTFDAYVALWSYLRDVDLTSRVILPFRPPDEAFRFLLADPRRLAVTRSTDYLWCRIVDVGSALAQRRYEVADSLVLNVRDPFCPWNDGRWRVEGAPDRASCSRTDDLADITLDASELGSIFLGGTRLSTLAAAQRVEEHTPGAMLRADRFFATARQPWCQTFF
jgi:predicted acetyltransferase